jgi:pimeloyl-ACP methyl ester carboxylesterase
MANQYEATYIEYGEGKDWLLAFHGYGMDGNQFQILTKSLTARYRIIGFHLPYHKSGPTHHVGWMRSIIEKINELINEYGIAKFSLAGYSIGAKVALQLIPTFQKNLRKIYLMAPYGLEKHWGLSFVSKGFGNQFFKTIINSKLPEKIMVGVKKIGIIDDAHHTIIQNELDTSQKRHNLCHSLFMIGQIRLNILETINIINQNRIVMTIVYGRSDVIFPFEKRNKKLLSMINNCVVLEVNDSHWLMTTKLDELLNGARR